jgi:hypothetical protein
MRHYPDVTIDNESQITKYAIIYRADNTDNSNR